MSGFCLFENVEDIHLNHEICPPPGDLRKLLDDRGAGRPDLESHLADCVGCRMLVAELITEPTAEFKAPAGLVRSVMDLELAEGRPIIPARRGSRSGAHIFAAVIGILVLAAGTFYLLNPAGGREKGDTFRSDTGKSGGVTLVGPADNFIVGDVAVEFVWKETPTATDYVVVVSDEKGDVIREFVSSSARISVASAEIGAESGRLYFWYVKARLIDGTRFESEVRRLRRR